MKPKPKQKRAPGGGRKASTGTGSSVYLPRPLIDAIKKEAIRRKAANIKPASVAGVAAEWCDLGLRASNSAIRIS